MTNCQCLWLPVGPGPPWDSHQGLELLSGHGSSPATGHKFLTQAGQSVSLAIPTSRDKKGFQCSSPPLSVENVSQDPRWMPETTDDTKPINFFNSV